MNHQKFANFILRQVKDRNEVKLPNIPRADYEKIKELLMNSDVDFDDTTQTFKPKKSSQVNQQPEQTATSNKQEVIAKDNITVTTTQQQSTNSTPVQSNLVTTQNVQPDTKQDAITTQQSVTTTSSTQQETSTTTYVRVHLIMSEEVEKKIKELTGINRTTKAIYEIINEYFKSKNLEEPFKVKRQRLNIFDEVGQ